MAESVENALGPHHMAREWAMHDENRFCEYAKDPAERGVQKIIHSHGGVTLNEWSRGRGGSKVSRCIKRELGGWHRGLGCRRRMVINESRRASDNEDKPP